MTSERCSDGAPVVLLVDDEEILRELAAEALAEAGFEVVEAANADAALAILQSRSDVRVLVTDVNMPGTLNGFEFARLAQTRWPGVAAIVVSGEIWPRPGDMPVGGEFLKKPFRAGVLVERVRERAQPSTP